MQRSVASVIVQVIVDIYYGLDRWNRRRVRLSLLHVREMTAPGPGVGVSATVLRLHKGCPGVVFDVRWSDEIHAVDS